MQYDACAFRVKLSRDDCADTSRRARNENYFVMHRLQPASLSLMVPL